MTPASRDGNRESALSDETLREPLDSLSIELGRISAEIQSINSGFQAQMQQAFAEARAEIENQYRIRFDKAMEELREQLRSVIKDDLQKEFDRELRSRISHLAEVQKEIQRVAAQLESVAKEIAAMLDDPSIELSKVMRKRTEQAELKAYLEGLRFSIGEQSKARGQAQT
ncbi:MAG: hypothetical protein HYU27_08995 [Acidobacteria bacterium]|nr:hypothetical protein [Acidobacteriota bacterium]